MLTMLRFSLSREIDNLDTSFKEAALLKKLPEFYMLLSMRQVFTVPQGQSIERGKFTTWVPKAFTLAPLATYTAVVGHDFMTADVGDILNHSFV